LYWLWEETWKCQRSKLPLATRPIGGNITYFAQLAETLLLESGDSLLLNARLHVARGTLGFEFVWEYVGQQRELLLVGWGLVACSWSCLAAAAAATVALDFAAAVAFAATTHHRCCRSLLLPIMLLLLPPSASVRASQSIAQQSFNKSTDFRFSSLSSPPIVTQALQPTPV